MFNKITTIKFTYILGYYLFKVTYFKQKPMMMTRHLSFKAVKIGSFHSKLKTLPYNIYRFLMRHVVILCLWPIVLIYITLIFIKNWNWNKSASCRFHSLLRKIMTLSGYMFTIHISFNFLQITLHAYSFAILYGNEREH